VHCGSQCIVAEYGERGSCRRERSVVICVHHIILRCQCRDIKCVHHIILGCQCRDVICICTCSDTICVCTCRDIICVCLYSDVIYVRRHMCLYLCRDVICVSRDTVCVCIVCNCCVCMYALLATSTCRATESIWMLLLHLSCICKVVYNTKDIQYIMVVVCMGFGGLYQLVREEGEYRQ